MRRRKSNIRVKGISDDVVAAYVENEKFASIPKKVLAKIEQAEKIAMEAAALDDSGMGEYLFYIDEEGANFLNLVIDANKWVENIAKAKAYFTMLDIAIQNSIAEANSMESNSAEEKAYLALRRQMARARRSSTKYADLVQALEMLKKSHNNASSLLIKADNYGRVDSAMDIFERMRKVTANMLSNPKIIEKTWREYYANVESGPSPDDMYNYTDFATHIKELLSAIIDKLTSMLNIYEEYEKFGPYVFNPKATFEDLPDETPPQSWYGQLNNWQQPRGGYLFGIGRDLEDLEEEMAIAGLI